MSSRADEEGRRDGRQARDLRARGTLAGPSAHLAFMRNNRHISFKESAERIKAVGARATSCSPRTSGRPATRRRRTGWAMLVNGLLGRGDHPRSDSYQMGRETPGKLLMG